MMIKGACSMEQHTTAAGSTQSLAPVRVESGLLAGIPASDPTIQVFKGVPYAAPPIGRLRWSAPQPPIAWDGIRRADTFGAICPQYIPEKGSFYQLEFYPDDQPQSEDCLFLNIWTGASNATERRPVMVWFHGGGMVEGSSSLPSFDGETLARKGVVLVTVNYRLGVFGFYGHPALSAEADPHVSGNYGLLDQIAALRWVRDNIAGFGGDPSNVTIFGQSAGSMSVYALLVSPLATGLFQRAIGQSGSPFSFLSNRTLHDVEQSGLAAAQRWEAESLDGLRALPTERLLDADLQSYRAMRYGLNIDGWAIPAAPTSLLVTGQQPAVSLMVGSTAHEFTSLLGERAMPAENFRQQIAQQYGEHAAAFLKLYPAESEDEARNSQIASLSDQMAVGMRAWASLHEQRYPESTYMYYFDRRLPGRNSEFYGAFHSGDLYYVFDTLASTERPWVPTDYTLAEIMSSYWANFAATGNPNGVGLPAWPAYRGSHVQRLGDTIEQTDAPGQARSDLFEQAMKPLLARTE
jgi:para-nitrobenzyl esterase